MSQFIEVESLLSVLVAGLVLGAGLPALFAFGVKMLTPETVSGVTRPISMGRKIMAYLSFGICILAVFAGVFFLAAGGHS
ncbi:hypothetical protein [Timonella sp. A28]|uniref:hypothetical protein n=1 Tax=Timonella sp. A28 TaxID=3442640 RepID=UPI003EC119DC